MDCNHARLLLTFAREHADLDQSEADGLEEHLGQCPECAAMFAAEQRTDAAIGKAMNNVPVPAGLKERLLAKLPRTRRSWRRWIVSTAAAAVLLLAVALSWHIWLAPNPELDYENASDFLVMTTYEERAPKEVEEYFETKDLKMAFPQQLNSRRLSCYCVGEIQGRRVPKLEFLDHASRSVAHVYVLSGRHFNIDSEVPSPFRNVRTHSMYSFRQGQFRYLVIYTGSLEPFLNLAALQ